MEERGGEGVGERRRREGKGRKGGRGGEERGGWRRREGKGRKGGGRGKGVESRVGGLGRVGWKSTSRISEYFRGQWVGCRWIVWSVKE